MRIAALVWAVDTMDLGVRPHLYRAIARPPVSSQLLQVYLAARQLLTPAEVAHLRARTIRSTGPDRISPDVVEPVLRDKALSPDVLAIALRCVAVDPRDRYPGASELARDLDRLEKGQPSQARELRKPAPDAVRPGSGVMDALSGVFKKWLGRE